MHRGAGIQHAHRYAAALYRCAACSRSNCSCRLARCSCCPGHSLAAVPEGVAPRACRVVRRAFPASPREPFDFAQGRFRPSGGGRVSWSRPLVFLALSPSSPVSRAPLMKLLAIRLSRQTTPAKSLVISPRRPGWCGRGEGRARWKVGMRASVAQRNYFSFFSKRNKFSAISRIILLLSSLNILK